MPPALNYAPGYPTDLPTLRYAPNTSRSDPGAPSRSLGGWQLQAGLIHCPPDCSWEPAHCPPQPGDVRSCGWGAKCPLRRCARDKLPNGKVVQGKCEPVENIVNRTLAVVHAHLPPPLAEQPTTPRLLLVTVTFPHTLQLLKLRHCTVVLRGVPNVLWIVAEDAALPSEAVGELLGRSGIPHRHVAYGPTRKGGNAQRNVALKLIRRERLSGIVYQMDDDNAYHPLLWPELRQLRPMRAGVVAVRRGVYPGQGCDGVFYPLDRAYDKREHMIERPSYDRSSGRFLGFHAGWCDPKSWLWRNNGKRTFCIDMAGFAFDAALLSTVVGAPWNYTGHGGESELLSKVLGPRGVPEDLQPLGNCGQDVFVFHNEYRSVPIAIRRPTARCAADGWGFGDDAARRRPARPVAWASTYRAEHGLLFPGKPAPAAAAAGGKKPAAAVVAAVGRRRAAGRGAGAKGAGKRDGGRREREGKPPWQRQARRGRGATTSI